MTRRAASWRSPTRGGVRPEQVVLDAVQAEVGSEDDGANDDTFSSVLDERRAMVFDGTLRSEIDSTVEDPSLAVR